jgi:hypothetical protein
VAVAINLQCKLLVAASELLVANFVAVVPPMLERYYNCTTSSTTAGQNSRGTVLFQVTKLLDVYLLASNKHI